MKHSKKAVFLFILWSVIVVTPQLLAMGSSQTDVYTIDFNTLGYDTKVLSSPHDTANIYFGFPADWQLNEGARIQLNTTTVFTGLPAKDDSTPPGGMLEIFFNDVFLEAHTISEEGDYNIDVAIPVDALQATSADGRHHLYLVFDSQDDCRPNMTVLLAIENSSTFTLPYEQITPPTDVSLYPYPIYQRSFLPDSALVLVPSEPTVAEMQAALSIMAGLGHQTDGKLNVMLLAEDDLTTAQMRDNDLIIVGNIDNSSLIGEMALPVPLTEDGFAQLGAELDDGIVQMLLSPWNETNVVMVVTGATDEAVIKAGQAVSAGDIKPNKRLDVAVITAVEPHLVQTAGYREKQTFADLGYKVKTLDGPGSDITRYDFYIPPGYGKDGESAVDLSFAHSALLDENMSGLFVRLNKELIGSVKFDNRNAGLTTAHIPLPDSVMKTGWNELTIEGDLLPYDACLDPERDRSWLTIYPESTLTLSLKEDIAGFNNPFMLSVYPESFTLESTLGNVAVILPADAAGAWNTAGTLLYDLGNQTEMPLADFAVAFADDVPEGLSESHEWLVVGQPIDLPILQLLQDELPAPFVANKNELAESAFPVSYQVLDGQEMGFLELLHAPDNVMRTIVAVLGNSDDSTQWAADKLMNAAQYNLNGNFALVTDSQVSVSMATFKPLVTSAITTTVSLTETAVASNEEIPHAEISQPPTNSSESPNWLLPVLNMTIGLIVLILVGMMIYYLVKWLRHRRTA